MNSSAGREGSRLKVEDVVEQDLQPSILSSGAAERLSSQRLTSPGTMTILTHHLDPYRRSP
jgi:hypothetical protein